MSILFLLLALLLAASATCVLISNFFAWYEAANRRPSLLEDGFGISRMLWAARLLATETALLLLTLLLRPLGWKGLGAVRHRERLLEAKTPVILLHGLFHNSGCWWWIRHRLQQQGVPVFALNLPLWRQNIEPASNRVCRLVEELRIALGVEKVHLVGHSMGGLVAMHYLNRVGAAKVDRCILLGAPVHGSKMAALAISPMGRGLLPESPLVRELAAIKPPPQVRMTSIFSRHDNLVLPPENARLEGIREIELTGVQHTGLLYHPRAVAALLAELTEEASCAPLNSTAASGWK